MKGAAKALFTEATIDKTAQTSDVKQQPVNSKPTPPLIVKRPSSVGKEVRYIRKKKGFMFMMDPDLYTRLKRRAFDEERPMNELISKLIEDYLQAAGEIQR